MWIGVTVNYNEMLKWKSFLINNEVKKSCHHIYGRFKLFKSIHRKGIKTQQKFKKMCNLLDRNYSKHRNNIILSEKNEVFYWKNKQKWAFFKIGNE